MEGFFLPASISQSGDDSSHAMFHCFDPFSYMIQLLLLDGGHETCHLLTIDVYSGLEVTTGVAYLPEHSFPYM
jgi:hypothetical protein